MPSLTKRVSVALAAAAVIGSAGSLLAAPALTGTAAAAGSSILGPDVSSFQHPGGASINWTKVQKSGVKFAIVKATEGTYYTNPYFASDYAGAAQSGLVHGAYHFARPATPVASSARSQARDFAAAIGAVNTANTLPPALDLEVTGGLGQAQLIRWAQDFLLDLRRLTGRTPLLYTYPTFWSSTLNDPAAFARYPIWMASYSSYTPSGAALWQFTDSASLSGIKGGVDESKYLTSTSWPWATVSNGTVATPWVASAPGAPQQVWASAGTGTSSGGSVVVHWLPGDSGTQPISGFTVTASSGRNSVTVGSSSTSATLTGLTYGRSYTFNVTATNSVGTGAATTSNSVTPMIPTAVAVTEPATITAGGKVTVTGTLTRTDSGQPLVGQTVTLLRKPAGATAWRQAATGTTDEKGTVNFVRGPHRDTAWELSYAGGSGYLGSSGVLETPVRPAVTVTADAKAVKVGDWVHLDGTVTPKTSQVTLTRQILVNGTWVNTRQHQTVDAGAFRFAFKLSKAGTVITRIWVGAAGGREAAHSGRVRITAS